MIDFLVQHIWFMPLYGFLGAILSLPWALGFIRETGQRPASYINIFLTIIALMHGSLVFFNLGAGNIQTIDIPWFSIAELDLTLAIEISPISVTALEAIAVMSLLAQVFAVGYMEKDWSLARFFRVNGLFRRCFMWYRFK